MQYLPTRTSLILVCGVLLVQAVQAEFLIGSFPPDARARGMGAAHVSLPAGPWRAWWNPGALGLEQGLTTGFSAEVQESGSSQAYGMTYDGPFYGLGASLIQHAFEATWPTDDGRRVQEKRQLTGTTGHLGFGLDLSGSNPNVRIAVGASLKLFREVQIHETWLTDEGYRRRKDTESYWDLLLGALLRVRIPLARPRPGAVAQPPHIAFHLGGVAKNALGQGLTARADVGLNSLSGSVEAHHRFTRAGLACEWVPLQYRGMYPPIKLLAATDWEGVLYSDENEELLSNDNPISAYGLELTLGGVLALRMGTLDRHTAEPWLASYGVGLDLTRVIASIAIDYAASDLAPQGGLHDGEQLHTVSVAVRF